MPKNVFKRPADMAKEVYPELEAIEAHAAECAHHHDSVNDCCPYSFYSPAGQAFKKAFVRERMALALKTRPMGAAKAGKASNTTTPT